MPTAGNQGGRATRGFPVTLGETQGGVTVLVPKATLGELTKGSLGQKDGNPTAHLPPRGLAIRHGAHNVKTTRLMPHLPLLPTGLPLLMQFRRHRPQLLNLRTLLTW